MPYEEECTPLLAPTTAMSKILSEVCASFFLPLPITLIAYDSLQTKVYPLIHLIRVDILTHIGQSRRRSICAKVAKGVCFQTRL